MHIVYIVTIFGNSLSLPKQLWMHFCIVQLYTKLENCEVWDRKGSGHESLGHTEALIASKARQILCGHGLLSLWMVRGHELLISVQDVSLLIQLR